MKTLLWAPVGVFTLLFYGAAAGAEELKEKEPVAFLGLSALKEPSDGAAFRGELSELVEVQPLIVGGLRSGTWGAVNTDVIRNARSLESALTESSCSTSQPEKILDLILEPWRSFNTADEGDLTAPTLKEPSARGPAPEGQKPAATAEGDPAGFELYYQARNIVSRDKRVSDLPIDVGNQLKLALDIKNPTEYFLIVDEVKWTATAQGSRPYKLSGQTHLTPDFLLAFMSAAGAPLQSGIGLLRHHHFDGIQRHFADDGTQSSAADLEESGAGPSSFIYLVPPFCSSTDLIGNPLSTNIRVAGFPYAPSNFYEAAEYHPGPDIELTLTGYFLSEEGEAAADFVKTVFVPARAVRFYFSTFVR